MRRGERRLFFSAGIKPCSTVRENDLQYTRKHRVCDTTNTT